MLSAAIAAIRRFWSSDSESESGQAIAEFAIAFPLQLFIVFGIMQMILIHVSTLLTNYAAYRACRTAVVAMSEDDPLALARTAAQLILAPVAGSHIEGGKAAPVKVPGWGDELNRSDFSGSKVFVHADGDMRGPECRILVEYNQELLFPVVDQIFALFLKEKTEKAEERVFGTEETGFSLGTYAGTYGAGNAGPADAVRESAGRVRKIGGAYHLVIVRECTMYRQVSDAKDLYAREESGQPTP